MNKSYGDVEVGPKATQAHGEVWDLSYKIADGLEEIQSSIDILDSRTTTVQNHNEKSIPEDEAPYVGESELGQYLAELATRTRHLQRKLSLLEGRIVI